MPVSVSFGTRWRASVTIATLDATCAMVSIQKAGVLSACIAVKSGSSSSSDSAEGSLFESPVRVLPVSPSGRSPMSSGRSRIALTAGPVIRSSSTPIPIAAPLSSYHSIATASTGTKSPPRWMPDIEHAIAKERRRLNQLFTIAIRASHPPSPVPSEMNMYAP